MKFGAIMTVQGRTAYAAATENGLALDITHCAIGTLTDEEYNTDNFHTGTETALRNERDRVEINGYYKTDDNPLEVIYDAIVPDNDDHPGGFEVREVGWFTSDGALAIIGKHATVEKPTDSQGAKKDLYLQAPMTLTSEAAPLYVNQSAALVTRKQVFEDDNTYKGRPKFEKDIELQVEVGEMFSGTAAIYGNYYQGKKKILYTIDDQQPFVQLGDSGLPTKLHNGTDCRTIAEHCAAEIDPAMKKGSVKNCTGGGLNHTVLNIDFDGDESYFHGPTGAYEITATNIPGAGLSRKATVYLNLSSNSSKLVTVPMSWYFDGGVAYGNEGDPTKNIEFTAEKIILDIHAFCGNVWVYVRQLAQTTG